MGPSLRSRVTGKHHRPAIRAVISGGDNSKTVEGGGDAKGVVEIQEDLSLPVSSSGKGEEGIDVRAVITIRKKMKEKLTDKIEDQWESFITGIGQGILIQLISEDIDPGTYFLIVMCVFSNIP